MDVTKGYNAEEERRSERVSYECNNDSLTLEYCKAQRRAMLPCFVKMLLGDNK